MRFIDKAIIHCADTYHNMDIGAADIRDWHMWPKDLKDGKVKYRRRIYNSREELPSDVRFKRGRGWTDIGYHYVIRRDGTLELGRPLRIMGAHCAGENRTSNGICFAGGRAGKGAPADNFTQEQMDAGLKLLQEIKSQFPEIEFYPHNAFSNKACPVFDYNLIVP